MVSVFSSPGVFNSVSFLGFVRFGDLPSRLTHQWSVFDPEDTVDKMPTQDVCMERRQF